MGTVTVTMGNSRGGTPVVPNKDDEQRDETYDCNCIASVLCVRICVSVFGPDGACGPIPNCYDYNALLQ